MTRKEEKNQIGNIKTICGLLFVIGLLSFAGAFISFKLLDAMPIPKDEVHPLGVLTFIFLCIGVITAGVGGGLFLRTQIAPNIAKLESQSRQSSSSPRNDRLLRASLFLFGIGAVVFTTITTSAYFEISRQYGLSPLGLIDAILQWPLGSYYMFSNLFGLQFLDYVYLLIALISPFLALYAVGKLEYPPGHRLIWFIIATLFPPSLIILSVASEYSVEMKKVFETAQGLLSGGILLILAELFLSSDGNDTVYIPGLRWISTDTVGHIDISGFAFLGLVIILLSILWLFVGTVVKSKIVKNIFKFLH